MDNTDRGGQPDHPDDDPSPAAVTFVTTEHFTLQGARSSTISESTGRASVFLGAVSGGLLAAVASGHSLVAALVAGVVVAAAALTGLMRYQNSTWIRGSTASLFPGAQAGPD